MSSSPLSRDVRQRDLIPPQRLAVCHAVVIGVGAVGRQVALQLAAVGVPRITLFDDDTVGVENLAPQAYWHDDVGLAKVTATATACALLNPAVTINYHQELFRRSSIKMLSNTSNEPPGERLAVFCCVDSIVTRRLIWETIRSHAGFFVDGRMSAEVVRVVTSDHPAADDFYPNTLFSAAQAYAGSCTAKSTVYTASIAAGLMLSAFTRWLRHLPIERDLTLNLLCGELTIA